MATKTEQGQAFPASAYLVVPDEDQPAGWKLRIWEDPDKKVTPRQLGRAAAALGPGFRGERVDLTRTQRAAAIRKLRALYRGQDVEPGDMPAVLQAAAHLVAQDRMRRNARKVMEAADLPEAMRPVAAEIREDLEILGEAWASGISAMMDGAVSFETVIAAGCKALEAMHRRMHDGESPYDCGGMRLVATFPDAVVYEHYGKLYQAGYEMDGTDVLLDPEEHAEVSADFLPVHGEMEEGARDGRVRAQRTILEDRPAGYLREAALDRDERVIRGTVLITAESVNGPGGKRTYTEKALRQIAAMAEGLPAFVNHVPAAEAFKPRDVKDLIGRHKGVRYDAAHQRVVSDLHVLEHQAPWVFALAEDMADVVGNSLVSRGLVRAEGDAEIVEEIVAVRSGDLVSDPGATRGLFEHRETWAGRSPSDGGHPMKDIPITEIQEALKADATKAATVREQLAGAELKRLGDELAAAAAKLAEATAKLDAHAAVESARAKAARVVTTIAESDLGKRYGTLPAAASEGFRAQLLKADESEWLAMLAERVKCLDEAAKAVGAGAPRSSFKAEPQDGVESGDVYARAYRALVGSEA